MVQPRRTYAGSASRPTRLHRSLSTVEYFAFGFGSMIGVGWLILMDAWLGRGGGGGVDLLASLRSR